MRKKSINSHEIKKNKIFDANYVFIDGMSRTGKAAVAPVVSSFKRVEHFKIKTIYDRVLTLYESGDLNKQGFKYLFESELITDLWSSMMGRDVNTNLHDISSIMSSPKRKKYIARKNRKDTSNIFDKISQEINKKNLIFPYISDDFLTIGTLLNEISKKFKYIIILRNPIDLVFTFFRSGRPSRLGIDPRYNKPAFKINKFKNLPISMLNMPKKFNQANLLEKSFLVVEKGLLAYLDSNLLNSKKVCLVPFENYCHETKKYVKILENFLGTSKTKFTKNEMIKARVPRKKDIDTFSKKANIIFDNMSYKYVKRLKDLCTRYETEISNTYSLNLIKKYPKNKFKGFNIDKFSKVSSSSNYHRGKRNLNK